MEAAQTLVCPNPCVYAPTKPTAAKARPFSATGALVICSDVPQVLNLGSRQWRCNSMVHAARRRFQLFFLSHTAPGAQLWFHPPLCMCSSHQSLFHRLLEHGSPSGERGLRWRSGCPGGRVLGGNPDARAHQAGRSPSGRKEPRQRLGCVGCPGGEGAGVAIGTHDPVRQEGAETVSSLPRPGWGAEEAMVGACEPALEGALPSAHGCGGQRVSREAAMAALPPAHHSTMALPFCSDQGFLHEHSGLWSSSLPSPPRLSPHSQQQSPLWVCSPNSTFPRVHWWTPASAWAVAWTIPVGLTLSCLPQTGCWALL